MATENAALLAFNRGIVSPQALARVDIERMRLSAEEQTNWLPRTLGSMMLRPGLGYIDATYAYQKAKHIPFVFGAGDTAIVECTPGIMRVRVNEATITRPAVTAVVTNGDFSSGAGWNLVGSGGATCIVSSGALIMSCSILGGRATAYRAVTINEPGIEHAFRIEVITGPVIFRCGTSAGADDVVTETSLGTGTHSLAFTPNVATVYPQLESSENVSRVVNSIMIEGAGGMLIPTPWTADNLPFLRWSQSGDVIYVGCYGLRQRRIERRATRSWSITLYEAIDGPMQSSASKAKVLTWVDAAYGNTTLRASQQLFKPTHIGMLFRMFTSGYNFAYQIGAEDTYSEPVRVTGVGADRALTYSIGGTWVGTWTLQRSFDGPTSGFIDVTSNVVNATTSLNDALDNSIVWYRIGFKSSAWASGSAVISLAWSGGGGIGIGRITGYTDPYTVGLEIIYPFTSSVKSSDWQMGEWSDAEGWPSTVDFHDGRLFWAGRDRIWGSVSDAFTSFSNDEALGTIGDSGAISRSLGRGPAQLINWLLPLQRLIVGAELSEVSIRSSSFDEPLTPTNLTLKDCSTQGSARIQAQKLDTRGIFVQGSKQKIYELAYSVDINDYQARDLNQLFPDMCPPGVSIMMIATQRQPDTRIHCLLSNGTVMVLTYEPQEEVICWWKVESADPVDDIVVVPDTPEDAVYYSVNRAYSGGSRHYLERFALEEECQGGALNKQSDSFKVYSGGATTAISDLHHLEGREVVVWGNGKDLGSYLVTGGTITGISEAVTQAVVGLPYSARFKSAKLAYAAQGGTALSQLKRIVSLGLLLRNTHQQSITFGQDFTTMDALPLVYEGEVLEGGAENVVHEVVEGALVPLPGYWTADARLCLAAQSPSPCTVLGAVIKVTTNEK